MDKKVLLSTLWIFLTVNFIFCDVFTLMHADDLKNILNGRVGDMQITQEFLLAFAVMMEIPMLMILLSRLLRYQSNRILNLIFGILLAIIQLWSLTVGGNTLHYWFFSIVEIAACIGIVWSAWKWKKEETAIR
ncbi:hypothetical protein JHJ32_08290 [Parapedobacter sp. ISTM3]|uniref:DoxX-like family protein n=1 Tax=Parapedobacter luteus TaxID=623280 RepID=A0A1T5BTL1_9SPHI|nr:MULTISPECIES: DUF6326 family protein [Parapedobacter]MBK1439980.1 hypothetical protein [Parapedobacter sp. ISTM3]SKB50506.1 hypothetical protein SAMN05660226_01739 [Parapedobacter luteus]